MKMKCGWFAMLSLLCGSIAYANEPPVQTREESQVKKYNLSVCAVFKNEAKYLKEWIEYHRLIGVEHFYLYNNKSSDRYRDVLKPYVNQGIVTLIQWPDFLKEHEENYDALWALSTQVPAYENAIKVRAADETKWLAIIDISEFLVPSGDAKIEQILQKYEEFPGLNFSIDCYDASIASQPNQKLVIEALEIVAQPPQNIQKAVEKTIFRPSECLGFAWPPYRCIFKDNHTPGKVDRNEMRINRYTNRLNGTLNLAKARDKLHVDNRLLSERDKAELLQEGYQIEDQEKAIYRYVPALLNKMGHESRSN